MTQGIIPHILQETSKTIRTGCADGAWGVWGNVPANELAAHAFEDAFEDAVSYVLYDVHGYDEKEVNEENGIAHGFVKAAEVVRRLFRDILTANPSTSPNEACEMLDELADGLLNFPPPPPGWRKPIGRARMTCKPTARRR